MTTNHGSKLRVCAVVSATNKVLGLSVGSFHEAMAQARMTSPYAEVAMRKLHRIIDRRDSTNPYHLAGLSADGHRLMMLTLDVTPLDGP
jgi:hypothetical protein